MFLHLKSGQGDRHSSAKKNHAFCWPKLPMKRASSLMAGQLAPICTATQLTRARKDPQRCTDLGSSLDSPRKTQVHRLGGRCVWLAMRARARSRAATQGGMWSQAAAPLSSRLHMCLCASTAKTPYTYNQAGGHRELNQKGSGALQYC